MQLKTDTWRFLKRWGVCILKVWGGIVNKKMLKKPLNNKLIKPKISKNATYILNYKISVFSQPNLSTTSLTIFYQANRISYSNVGNISIIIFHYYRSHIKSILYICVS